MPGRSPERAFRSFQRSGKSATTCTYERARQSDCSAPLTRVAMPSPRAERIILRLDLEVLRSWQGGGRSEFCSPIGAKRRHPNGSNGSDARLTSGGAMR